MKHLGNMTVTLETAADFPVVDSFFGHLIVGENVELRAPELTHLRGWVTVMPGAGFAAPKLGRIEGWLTLQPGSNMMAEQLVEITKDLIIGAHVNLDVRALQAVLGNVVLQREAVQELSLIGVRGNVSLGVEAELTAGHLGRIDGSITLRESARLDVPLLAHIGGFYDAEPTAVLHAPKFSGV